MNKFQSGILGAIVGDAFGVPYEFLKRGSFQVKPKMTGYGTYNQPAGTWSDDSSLTLATLTAIAKHGFDLDRVASYFVDFAFNNRFTPHGTTFDIGNTTLDAINNFALHHNFRTSGASDEHSNGNGSLMRILPVVYVNHNKPQKTRIKNAMDLSRITHAHPVSMYSCAIYAEYALNLIETGDPVVSYHTVRNRFTGIIPVNISPYFEQVIRRDISKLKVNQVESSGYVIDTLEAAFWCLLTTDTYQDAIMKAVALGGDTDTTACVTGGLAGILYGYDGIPVDWIEKTARIQDIKKLLVFFD